MLRPPVVKPQNKYAFRRNIQVGRILVYVNNMEIGYITHTDRQGTVSKPIKEHRFTSNGYPMSARITRKVYEELAKMDLAAKMNQQST